jgi:hypothetical protein
LDVNQNRQSQSDQQSRLSRQRQNRREWVEFRNLVAPCWLQGKSSFLQFRGRSEAARLYRENWDGCREVWKLGYVDRLLSGKNK